MVDAIDVPRVTAWLLGHVEGVVAPFTFEPIAGGRSNLTFAVTDAAGRRLVLRRPPMSHVLATAHDMAREHRIISALRGTPVPVPAALGYCGDEAVNGRPFYVMDFVEGHVLRDAAEVQATLGIQERKVAGYDLVDVLAALHAVDPGAAGLGDLARRDGYIERQLRRWHEQFQQSQQQEREAGVYRPVPLVDEVHALLAARVPVQRGVAIVHGDYRIDNTILSAQGRVRAVLDWELCTLGDPLADVGALMMYWTRQLPGGSPPPTAAPGFPAGSELARRYADRTGRDLTGLGFYEAFANWRLACILEGVYVRYAAHAMGADTGQADQVRLSAEDRARRAMAALRS